MTFLALDDRLALAPVSWRRTSFKRAFTAAERRAEDSGAPRLSLASAGYLYPREGAIDRQQASAGTEARSWLVETGDLVINPMWLTGGSIAVSALAGAVSPDYRVFRPIDTLHPRFAHHLLRSQPYIDQYALFVRANTTFDRRIQQVDLDSMPIVLPEPVEQQRIAGFLDDRVARIDRLIGARHKQIRLATATLDAAWAERAGALESSFGLTPIRRFLISIVDGPFGSSLASSHYSDAGTRVIRLGNIGLAAFRADDKAFISDAYGSQLAAHAVLPGDLIMAGLGDDRWPLGRCALAPAEIGPAIVKADCYRIRLDSRISHDYAACFLSSPPARQRFSMLARGATRARLNTDVARAAELAPAPAEAQRGFVTAVAADQEKVSRVTAELSRSIGLLTEYKTSLIAAAVTGEIDLTATGSRIPG